MSNPNYTYTYPAGYTYPPSTGDDEYETPGYRTSYTTPYTSTQAPSTAQPGQTWAGAPYAPYPAAASSTYSYSHQYPGQSQPAAGYSNYPSYQSTPGTYHQPYSQPYGGMGESVIPTTEAHTLAVPMNMPNTNSDRRAKSPSTGRTWTCDIPDCPSTAQFTRLADLQRHQNTVHHQDAIKPFSCTVARCSRVGSKGFTRRDHLTEHLRCYHHLDIRKRRPGERSAGPQ